MLSICGVISVFVLYVCGFFNMCSFRMCPLSMCFFNICFQCDWDCGTDFCNIVMRSVLDFGTVGFRRLAGFDLGQLGGMRIYTLCRSLKFRSKSEIPLKNTIIFANSG